nr:hypothetical protein [Tanacetum cinerariifolium]
MFKLQGFGHILDECPKKVISDALKNMKTPGKAIRGFHIGSKPHLVYRPFQLNKKIEKAPRKPKVPKAPKANNDTSFPTTLNSFKSFTFVDVGEGGVNLTSISMHITSMEEQVEESDSEVKDINCDTYRFMSLSNRASRGANDASLLEDEDYDIYKGYENDAYDLSDEQLTFYNAFDIHLHGRVIKSHAKGLKSGFLDLEGMKNNHKKKKSNFDGSTAMLSMVKEGAGVEFASTLEGSSSKSLAENIYVIKK